MYAKTCSQPKVTPTTKKEPQNQAHTRKPRTDTQKIPAHTRQREPTKTKPRPHNSPQRAPCRHSAPHPSSDGRHKITPSKRANTPPATTHDNPPEHTATLPPCTQENPYAPTQETRAHSRKSILRRLPNSKWKTPHRHRKSTKTAVQTQPRSDRPTPSRAHKDPRVPTQSSPQARAKSTSSTEKATPQSRRCSKFHRMIREIFYIFFGTILPMMSF